MVLVMEVSTCMKSCSCSTFLGLLSSFNLKLRYYDACTLPWACEQMEKDEDGLPELFHSVLVMMLGEMVLGRQYFPAMLQHQVFFQIGQKKLEPGTENTMGAGLRCCENRNQFTVHRLSTTCHNPGPASCPSGCVHHLPIEKSSFGRA